MIGSIRLSLDQVNLRLTTFNALGDSIVTIGPAVATMRAVKPALAKFLPSASAEFDSMTNTLNDLVVDSLDAGFELDPSSNQETEKILREAAAVASTYTSDKFPSPQQAYSTSQSSSLEDL
jgi:division protein CdvB (Snf7/Vps24/ESCRT-III family)